MWWLSGRVEINEIAFQAAIISVLRICWCSSCTRNGGYAFGAAIISVYSIWPCSTRRAIAFWVILHWFYKRNVNPPGRRECRKCTSDSYYKRILRVAMPQSSPSRKSIWSSHYKRMVDLMVWDMSEKHWKFIWSSYYKRIASVSTTGISQQCIWSSYYKRIADLLLFGFDGGCGVQQQAAHTLGFTSVFS